MAAGVSAAHDGCSGLRWVTAVEILGRGLLTLAAASCRLSGIASQAATQAAEFGDHRLSRTDELNQRGRPVTGVGMARRIIVRLEDDLDGSSAERTLRFRIGGVDYEIDLSQKNAARFRMQLAPFIEHARKAEMGPRRPVRTAASRRRSREIREWAKEQGISMRARGRIPASVIAQYEAARRTFR